MKQTILLLLALMFLSANRAAVFSQEKTQAEQIQSLHNKISALKKIHKQEKERMQAEIDFRDAWAEDIDKLLQTHDLRLITNKLLIQSTIEGTLMKIKAEQDATSAGYARTRKIFYAALGAGLLAVCCFIVALVLIHRRNKKNFLFATKILGEHKTDLETLKSEHEKDAAFLKLELNQLRAEWRLGAEARTKAIEEIRLKIENMQAAAAAHKKLSEERTTSLAFFQQQIEDKLDAINCSADGMADELKKQIASMEKRLEAVEIIKAQLKPKN